MFFKDNQSSTISSNIYRLSIIYFKNRKLFQRVSYLDDKYSSSLYNSEIGGTIVSVNVNTFLNSQIEKESDIVDYDIKYSKVCD
jgi:hypothetical protein